MTPDGIGPVGCGSIPVNRIISHLDFRVEFTACVVHYSSDEQKPIVSQGMICDVKSTEEEVSFSFDPAPVRTDIPCPLFVRVKEVALLIGIFSPEKNRFIHIHELSSETRTPPVIVSNGKFKGTEVGRRGSGPRAIHITAPDVKLEYDLKFQRDGKWWNPHHDGDYNKKGNQALLYQAALDAFVEGKPEGNFIFTCYGNLYKASK